VGTARGLARFDGQTWTSYRVGNGLLGELVLDLAVDPAGVVWLGTDRGVTRFDGEDWTHYGEDDGLPAGFVQVVELDVDGRVWFGFSGAGDDWAFGNGAARVDDRGTADKADDSWDVFLPTRDRMAGDIVSGVTDLGVAGVWFGVTPEGTVRGSGEGGLWRLLGAETTGEQDDVWTAFRVADGLAGNIVTALAASSEGGLWIGTTAGLMHAPSDAGGSLSLERARLYTTADGLPSDRVLSIADDSGDGVWVGTDAGLALIDDGVIRSITKSEGLADNAVRSVIVADDGAVWAATPSGVSVRR
jgi:ligand-binding sensor domain-containing protein